MFLLLNKIQAVLKTHSPIVSHSHHHEPENREAIRILSANICHTWPKRNFPEQRMTNFLQMVSEHNFDVILLQEVWRSEQIKMNEWLAERLKMHGIYSRTNGDEQQIGFEEGLAIFSRFPIQTVRQKFFRSSMYPFARRQALATKLDTPLGILWAVSVHLSILPWRNRQQIKELSRWLDSFTENALIGGDFNAPETFSHIKNLKRKWMDTLRFNHPHGQDTHTHKIKLPLGKTIKTRLDYLFLKQNQPRWNILDAGRMHSHSISDHLAIWTLIAPS